MERVERRGNIARAFSRIRIAMKRRRPATVQNTRNDQPVEVTADLQTLEAQASTSRFLFEHPTTILDRPSTPLSDLTSTTPKDACSGHRLEPDTEEHSVSDENWLPIASIRPGISDSKARDLHSRYGLLYQLREHTSQEEPPRKLRRVERPIYMRVHWTCHTCKSQFIVEKTCVGCGHRRCARCSRQPPRRVQDVLETGEYLIEQSELSQQGVVSSEDASREPSANSTPNSTPVHSAMPSPSLSSQLDASIEPDGQVEHSYFDSSINTRPNGAVRFFGSNYYPGHFEEHLRVSQMNKCSLGLSGLRNLSNGEVSMVRSVQRVYRKPRQRVRYTCEHCATLLVEGDRCRECDHDRFHRNPPKRTAIQYDADILQIVANRLAAQGGGFVHQ